MAVRANPNLTQRALMVAGLAIAIIAGVVAGQIWYTYNATVTTARRDIQQLTQLLDASTDTTFRSVELIIDHTIQKILNTPDLSVHQPALISGFITTANDWPFIRSVAHVTHDGIIRNMVLRRGDGRLHAVERVGDVSGQPLFLVHRDRPASAGSATYIARAGQDVVSRQWVITISKAVRDKDGVFRGVCLVTIPVDAFSNLLAALLPSRYTAVELLRSDGALLASTVENRKTGDGEPFVFKEMLPLSPAGVYRITPADKSNEQLLSYRALDRYPVVITVIALWKTMLASWWNASVVLGAAGLTGILVITAFTGWLVRRIAAEQKVKRALERSERSLVEAQRLSGISYFERYAHTGKTMWPANMFSVHGVEPATFSPNRENFLTLVLPEDRAKILEVWGNSDVPPPSGAVECRIGLPDGEIRHMRYSWKTLDEGKDSPPRIFGVAQDVTAIRSAEDIIRDDAERLGDIVECSSDYIWEVNAGGIITFFTGSGTEQFGQVLGKPSRIFNEQGAENGGDLPVLHRAMKERAKFRSLVVPRRTATGELRWLRISGNPRFDGQGRYLGYRGASADVTDLRKQQERDEDQRKAEALGRLASGLAHEINNLLQPILIYANFGASQSTAANLKQYFSRITRAAEGATQIVRNVLAFARQSPPIRENVNMSEVVREIADLIGGTLGAGTTISVTAIDDLTVRVDRTGLAQVLTNLITNAAEAVAPGGHIVVSANAANLTGDGAKALNLAPGVYCRLSVEDNGPGVGVDQIGKVFDPFFTTKPQGKGTGLGLSVVLGLAKSWGGTATVESQADVRTCFTVYLPLAERHLQAAQ